MQMARGGVFSFGCQVSDYIAIVLQVKSVLVPLESSGFTAGCPVVFVRSSSVRFE